MSLADSNPCLDCGACCASFRVSFYWSEAEARGLPAELTEQVNAWFSCMAGTNQARPTASPWRARSAGGELPGL
jgi:Fe-S-cluster containining protein